MVVLDDILISPLLGEVVIDEVLADRDRLEFCGYEYENFGLRMKIEWGLDETAIVLRLSNRFNEVGSVCDVWPMVWVSNEERSADTVGDHRFSVFRKCCRE